MTTFSAKTLVLNKSFRPKLNPDLKSGFKPKLRLTSVLANCTCIYGVVGCWRGYLSAVRCRLTYGPADAIATVSCFSKIQIGLPFWYRLTRLVLDEGPLNGCVCAMSTFNMSTTSDPNNVQTFYQRESNACGLVAITCAFQRYVYVILHLEISRNQQRQSTEGNIVAEVSCCRMIKT